MSSTDELKNKIASQIIEQVNKIILKNDNNDSLNLKSILINGIIGDYLTNIDSQKSAVEEFFKNNIIELRNLIVSNKEDLNLFHRLYNVNFLECNFVTDFNFLENNRYLFKNCKFNAIEISNCKTFEHETLFINCSFNSITFKLGVIDISLFDSCQIKEFEARNIIFKKEVFFDTYNTFFQSNRNDADYDNLSFYDCLFEKNFFIGIESKINFLNFLNCNFFKELNLKIRHPIENLKINFCNFFKKVDINSNIIKKQLIISNSRFKDNLILDDSEINMLTVEKNIFERIFSLSCKEIKFSVFKNNSFEILNLRNCRINELDLSKTTYIGKADFWGIKTCIKNRETARIIKDSFEQQNNIIEANKFYALEMKEREEELKQDREEGKNFFEWLVFKIHGLSSNHSQDWVLSLFWILSFSFGYSFMSCVNSQLDTKLEYILTDAFIYIFVIYTSILIINYKKMNKFYLTGLFYILYVNLSKDFTLQTFSNNLNPFSIMTEFSQLNFSTMFYKITIAYLIYQFIISIRQNTRRK